MHIGTLKSKSAMNILLINLEMKLSNANIYDKRDLSPSANPNQNYELLAEQLETNVNYELIKL